MENNECGEPAAGRVTRVEGTIRAGFPSPAQDYMHTRITLDDYLIEDRTSTYIVRVAGDSMEGAGIYDGDEVIVDRAMAPRDGDIVVAVVDGDLTIKRLALPRGGALGGVVQLLAENPLYPPVELAELSELTIWGVAIHGIRHFR